MLRTCQRCGHCYLASGSTALLRLTFCTAMCESNELHFDIRRCTNRPTRIAA